MTAPRVDLIERARPFLQQCGSCDAGLPMACTCPSGDYRPVMADLVAEVERLRQRTQPGGDDMSDKVSARDLTDAVMVHPVRCSAGLQ
jgi:hypothetical protein